MAVGYVARRWVSVEIHFLTPSGSQQDDYEPTELLPPLPVSVVRNIRRRRQHGSATTCPPRRVCPRDLEMYSCGQTSPDVDSSFLPAPK